MFLSFIPNFNTISMKSIIPAVSSSVFIIFLGIILPIFSTTVEGRLHRRHSFKNASIHKGTHLLIENTFNYSTPGDAPYAVMILVKIYDDDTTYQVCSGVLLTRKYVMTAAICFWDTSGHIVTDFIVYAGGSSRAEFDQDIEPEGSQRMPSEWSGIHPRNKKGKGLFDVGLIRVTGSGFELNDVVQTIKLATQEREQRHRGTTNCTVTGFGRVQLKDGGFEPNKRKTHPLQIEAPCQCEDYLNDQAGYPVHNDWILCTGPKSTYRPCFGDSGAGLTCEGKVWGVMSQKYDVNALDVCNFRTYPQGQEPPCAISRSMITFFQTCWALSWIIPIIDPKGELYPDVDESHYCWHLRLPDRKRRALVTRAGSEVSGSFPSVYVHITFLLLFFLL